MEKNRKRGKINKTNALWKMKIVNNFLVFLTEGEKNRFVESGFFKLTTRQDSCGIGGFVGIKT
jgi:hypothetical protein